MSQPHTPRIMIVCLGDLGRSPRMQYHALSAAHRYWHVDLVGLTGAECMQTLTQHSNVTIHRFSPLIKFSFVDSNSRLVRILLAPVKILSQCYQLLRIMLFQCHSPPDTILVQNPPSIPLLLIALIVSVIRQAYLVIDWHNFGYSILSMGFSDSNNRMTMLARWYEHTIGRLAHGHLCVTTAMKLFLEQQWGIAPVTVLYDRPSEEFRRLSVSEQHAMWQSLAAQGIIDNEAITRAILTHPARAHTRAANKHIRMEESTLFTYYDGSGYHYRNDRPAVIVSSTSWTADEDFNLLLTALMQYERACEEEIGDTDTDADTDSGSLMHDDSDSGNVTPQAIHDLLTDANIDGLSLAVETLRRHRQRQSLSLPPLLVIITGKGPLQSAFLTKLSLLSLQHCHVITPFLAYEDYPRLLGSVDLGLSFHTSSSGLDLPMKVVDMFGAALPVCAIRFQCLPELLGSQQGQRGFVFDNGESLSLYLQALFGMFPNTDIIEDMRRHVVEWAMVRWEGPWNLLAAPVIYPPYATVTNAVPQSSRSPLTFLSSPLTLVSSSLSLALSLIRSVPLHWLYVLLLMLAAIIYRSTLTFLPVLTPLYNDPMTVLTEHYHRIVDDYYTEGVYGLIVQFAHSDIASWIVLCVIIGTCFWLFALYRVNRAVADEEQVQPASLSETQSGSQSSLYSSLVSRARKSMARERRTIVTSSEEEKE